MKRKKKRCPYCHLIFSPHPRIGENQITCGAPACKRKRKTARSHQWVKQNLLTVMANQRDWHKHHPHYYLTYRSKNPEYSERNRIQTRTRKSLLKSGLQNVLDISQLTDLSAQYCGTTRFAKCPPMTDYLLLVYKRLCTMKLLGHRRIEMSLRYAKVTPALLKNEYFSALQKLETLWSPSSDASIKNTNSSISPANLIELLRAFSAKEVSLDPNRKRNLLKRLDHLKFDLANINFLSLFPLPF